MFYFIPDCSRAGDFRSITSHFRQKRSVDSSFPREGGQQHGAPVPDVSPPFNDLVDDKNPEADVDHSAVDHSANGVMNEMMKVSHKMIDAVEVRIEGMEDVVITLQNSVHGLRRKVDLTFPPSCLHVLLDII